jgi:uncharacterized protein (TIGR00299 family) protein
MSLFAKLAEAESKVHGSPLDRIHFHEVGALDSIIDISAAVILLEMLGAETIISSPVNTGHGTVKTLHGILPIPSPAAEILLRKIPSYADFSLPPMEMTTPTGALILSELCEIRNADDVFLVEKSAFGAGSFDSKIFANVLRANICRRAAEQGDGADIVVIETVLDDATGEETAFLSEKLSKNGAIDTIIIPALGKKGRPTQLIQSLVPKDKLEDISKIILLESTGNGLRYRLEKRKILERKIIGVKTPFGGINVKLTADFSGKIIKTKAEHDMIKQLAEKSNNSYIVIKKKLEAFLNSKYIGKQL